MWNANSSRIDKRHSVICMALWVALMLSAVLSPAQDSPDEPIASLTMDGFENVDPKERISGAATVGINYFKNGDEFNPNAIFVYFADTPVSQLTTQLTTVDGRYIAEFTTAGITVEDGAILEGHWRHLKLNLEDQVPLNTDFLKRNYNQDSEIAMLVSDGGNKAFPVRWGSPCATDYVRIRVNTEGADAYVVSFEDRDKEKGKLVRCDPASAKSQFKFDHFCDMHLQDIDNLDNVQIIRKRGATYEKAISVNISVPPNKDLANSSDQCDRQ